MHITVNAIITHNKKVLLVKKQSASGRPSSIWELPGGLITASSTSIEQAAAAAIEHELGVPILPTGRWFNHIYKQDITITLSATLCDERYAYAIKPNHTIVDFMWADSASLASFDITPLTRDRILSVQSAPVKALALH